MNTPYIGKHRATNTEQEPTIMGKNLSTALTERIGETLASKTHLAASTALKYAEPVAADLLDALQALDAEGLTLHDVLILAGVYEDTYVGEPTEDGLVFPVGAAVDDSIVDQVLASE